MASSNNRTSALVSSQVPKFVKDDHPTFVTFLEDYYKFLEQDGQLLYTTKNFLNFLDIDNITDDILHDNQAGEQHILNEENDYHAFLQKIYDAHVKLIPANVLADKTLLLKYVKDFYRAKGTENSVKFLLRLFFNKESDFYYPKVDVLRASDGKWFVEKSLKITDVAVNNVSNSLGTPFFYNHKIFGTVSNATAVVEKVDTYFDRGKSVTELKLSGTKRDFINGEKIYTIYTEEGVDKFLTANLYSGIISTVRVIKSGSGYVVGTNVPVESNTGTGAQIVISSTTTGNLKSIGVLQTGAGFKLSDGILITGGGGGSGATANVTVIDSSGNAHPNTYNVVGSQIFLEANTTLDNVVYSNLNASNANTQLANAFTYWTYGPCGPVLACEVYSSGSNYSLIPSVDIKANSVIRSLGILATMKIVSGGSNYQIGDEIVITNVVGSFGTGASANVTNVDANGVITQVKFKPVDGFIVGGCGYNAEHLPLATVVSANGNGANVVVTAILGDNEQLIPVTDSVGGITGLQIISGGSGYLTVPTLNLSSFGDGTAQANVTIVTGVYTYPGKYLNDDGHISSYNFLQDRDYYQSFSYVVRIDEPINKYRKALTDLTHPLGMKIFGEYNYLDQNTKSITVDASNFIAGKMYNADYYVVYKNATYNVNMTAAQYSVHTYTGLYYVSNTSTSGTFTANGNTVSIKAAYHGFAPLDKVYVSFTENASANIVNGIYSVVASNTRYLSINLSNTTNIVNGNVTVYNPEITIYNDGTLFTNNIVDLVFSTDDTSLTNTVYTIYNTQDGLFSVLHPNITSAVSVTGNVSIRTNIVNITSNNHGYSVNDTTYLRFTSGDNANVTNGLYTIKAVSENVFSIYTANIGYADGNAINHLRSVNVTLNNNGFANSENIQIWFTTGDVANATNSVYRVSVIDSNTFILPTTNVMISNGNAKIYSNNIYFIVNKDSHGFVANDFVRMEFATGDLQSLGNDVFNIVSANSNSFNVMHSHIVISNTITAFDSSNNSGVVRISTYA